LILELQRIVTEGTLDDPNAAGRLQEPGEERVEVRDEQGALLHRPPPAEQLLDRISALCEFANATGADGAFLHPVVRSILIHFWLAYDHPFIDGNGRTARALFYWSMLRQGYWLSEYLSISRLLRRASARYARAFLYVETDDLDVTYFVLFQLKIIGRAIDELHAYLKRKMEEVSQVEALARRSRGLNHRQLDLIGHALRHPGAEYTYQSHATSHRVVRQSARTDLLKLASRGLLRKRKVGREFVFSPAPNLAERLK
jgi:Fic family protein